MREPIMLMTSCIHIFAAIQSEKPNRIKLATISIVIQSILLVMLINASCKSPDLVSPSQTPCQNPDQALIPAGWFLMGENDGRPSNQPQHQVYLDAYCIQRTEVTRQDFAAFITATAYQAPGWESTPVSSASRQLLPVVGVRWRDADRVLPLVRLALAQRGGMGKSRPRLGWQALPLGK